MPQLSPSSLLLAALVLTGAATRAETLDAQLARGEAVYAEHCAQCHGPAGEGGAGYPNPIVGSRNLDKFKDAMGLWRYHRMMMPFDDPSRLDADAKWDVTAHLMQLNGWLDGLDAPLGPETAPGLPIPGS
jgi:cytochrome c